ncbi:hypothetical protein HMPREF9474_03690 [ [[Clostridium] symbiosum WAL-14163]|uniref:Uncharacterized protein n=1 Tax=Clostridium symbiosum (strain WAL-14163) TaxID=742740 RepID=E7GRZ5_CLOS6|nr:hypothetical protein HMPREF9474_03690 [ [[Clostridium] symbiosum WAL-14163]
MKTGKKSAAQENLKNRASKWSLKKTKNWCIITISKRAFVIPGMLDNSYFF